MVPRFGSACIAPFGALAGKPREVAGGASSRPHAAPIGVVRDGTFVVPVARECQTSPWLGGHGGPGTKAGHPDPFAGAAAVSARRWRPYPSAMPTANALAPGAFRVETERAAMDAKRLLFEGELRFHGLHAEWEAVRRRALEGRGLVQLDLSGVSALDGGSAALLISLRSELCAAGRAGVLVGASGAVKRVLGLYGEHPLQPSEKAPPQRLGALEQIGAFGAGVLADVGRTLNYLGTVALEAWRSLRDLRRFPREDLAEQFGRTGADAVPIVVLILFLVGAILGLQASTQLETFGAEIFIADLVGLSIVRELGPLMTAIVLAGRTGAAFAAELGTMRVSEEVDALRTFGLSPERFLVLPRLVALLVAAPMLTLLADGIGVLGGGVVGVGIAGIAPVAYWNQTQSAIDLGDVTGGLVKSVVFAAIVGLVACSRGLATRGGAAGVGRATTSAVVSTIFYLVLADAAFTWAFDLLGV